MSSVTTKMDSIFYKPVDVFRQPAIIVKKRSERSSPIDSTLHHKRSWQNDASKIGSPLLRKASDDFNDYYTTKKLRSQFWKINHETRSSSLPTDLSVVSDKLLISNKDSKDNLKLLKIKQRDLDSPRLHEFQAISVPGTPIISTSLLPQDEFVADYVDGHDQLLLAGHQDGVVNLISTSTEGGNAKIVKRFKHGKFISHQDPGSLDNWLKSYTSIPVRKLKPWNQDGFVSLVNDSLFIYNINGSRTPQYLQSFPGIESFAVNNFKNPYLLSLCGSQFGRSGVALLDLRCDQRNVGNLYIPDGGNSTKSSTRFSPSHTSSYDCVWIDEFHLANCVNDTVKIWDIRSTGGETQCEIIPMKGCIESLRYHQETKTLYTSDDQDYVISWDLKGLDHMKKATLAQGFNSIMVQDKKELLHEVSQCGNIVVNGGGLHKQYSVSHVRGSLLMDTLSDGSLITLGSQELGRHQIHDVKCPAPTVGTPVADQVYPVQIKLADEGHMVEDSDSTLLSNELSSLSIHSDCSSSHTLHSHDGRRSPENDKLFQLEAAGTNLYSLNDKLLSGSTIYH